MNTNHVTGIFKKAVCLSLTLSSFSVQRKADKSKLETDADKAMLTFGKKLLDSQELKAISKLDAEIYGYLHWKEGQRSLPFNPIKEGIYLIPLALIDEVEIKLAEFATQRAKLVEAFIDVYPTRIQEAKARLGSQFNSKDYKSVDKVLNKFDMKWNIFIYEAPEALAEHRPLLYEKEKQKIIKDCEEAQKEILSIMRNESLSYMNGLIAKLTDSPDGSRRRLHESYVEKIKDFLNIFEARNIASDTQLSEAIAIARKALEGAKVQDLRDDDALRASVKKQFQDALSVFDTMMKDDFSEDFDLEESFSLNLNTAVQAA